MPWVVLGFVKLTPACMKQQGSLWSTRPLRIDVECGANAETRNAHVRRGVGSNAGDQETPTIELDSKSKGRMLSCRGLIPAVGYYDRPSAHGSLHHQPDLASHAWLQVGD